MKKLIVIAILVGIGWYGNALYTENRLSFLLGMPADSSYASTKCITRDGRVIYGDVPAGTVCQRREPVGGALTIISNKPAGEAKPRPNHPEAGASSNRCDGRIYCSQMRSCEEATYFSNHCPDVKMDGDNDGIPCETQWCN